MSTNVAAARGAPPSWSEYVGLAVGGLAGAGAALLLALHVMHPTAMPDALATLLWYGVRGAGVAAYLVLWLTIAAGLCLARRVTLPWLPTGALFFLHQLGDLALSLGVLHALLLLGDRFAGFTPATLAVPFQASYRPLWTGLGIVALYVAAIVQWSIHLRPRIGYRAWRAIHFLSYAVFGLALLHGLESGSDALLAPMRAMYLITGASVAALTVWRPRNTPQTLAAN
jgi:predicted ferric reductase